MHKIPLMGCCLCSFYSYDFILSGTYGKKRTSQRSSFIGPGSFDISGILFFKSPVLEKTPPKYLDVHAGWLETGIVAAYLPGLVNVKLARTLKPTRLAWADAERWIKSVRKVTPLGYAGDPAAFDMAEAKKYVEELTTNMADAIAKELKKK